MGIYLSPSYRLETGANACKLTFSAAERKQTETGRVNQTGTADRPATLVEDTTARRPGVAGYFMATLQGATTH